MRTTKLLPIVASIIASGLLVLATTSSAAVAQTSAASVIAQLNKQTAACISGGTNSLSCNQAAANTNLGNAVSVASGGGNDPTSTSSTSDPTGTSAFSGIFQTNKQTAACISGTSNSGSCNQAASNFNNGTAVSAAFG